MRNLWKLGALSAVCGAVLGLGGGCQDFDAAYEACKNEGRCEPGASGDGGPVDGGEVDAGVDAGDLTPPECGDGGTDYPDLLGFDNDCDGIDGNADAGYFVDPERGQDDGGSNGSRLQPFRTLARALDEIRSNGSGRTIVYLGTGTYNEPEPIVDVPVSLHGGYTWRGPGNQYWDRFKDGGAPTRFSGGTHAFLVRDVSAEDAGIILDSVHIAALDATNAGESSIALRALNIRELTLRGIVLEAGFGAPGLNGQPGLPGPDGGNGGPGNDSSDAGSFGGSEGQSNCSLMGFVGGRGGRGGGNGNGNPGSTGMPNTGNVGAAGIGKPAECINNICTCNGGVGGIGGAGSPGDTGAEGRAGGSSGRINSLGLWEADQQGGTGATGFTGRGGSGGGGGGNCSEINDDKIVNPTGGGGGGGGGGGCGGAGGGGGTGGGASIALVTVSSRVVIDQHLNLITRGGGTGGRGGPGGQGGQGGLGGQGGQRGIAASLNTQNVPYYVTSGDGGVGGNGGQGGKGGAGGGGGGGPSVGAWCVSSTIVKQQPFDAQIGPGGPGGPSEKDAGAVGASQESIDCTFVDAGTP
jgi:hypothetical protein